MKTLFIGGIKSGKSINAQDYILKNSVVKPTYLATTEFVDAGMKERIDAHIQNRGNDFITLEEPLKIYEAISANKNPVLVECVSMWINNMFYHKFSLEDMQKELKNILALNQDINNIKSELKQDLIEMNRVDSLVTEGLKKINIYINIANKKNLSTKVDSAIFLKTTGLTSTFFPMGSSYLVAQNSGRINKINDLSLLKSISKYYQNSYERLNTNNFMYDEFLNKNFFKFKATLDNLKSHEEIFKLFESGKYDVLFLEWRSRRTSYQNYVLNDLKTSANQLLINIDNYLLNTKAK